MIPTSSSDVPYATEAPYVEMLKNLYVQNQAKFNMIQYGGNIFMPKMKEGGPHPLWRSHLRGHLTYKHAIAVFAGLLGSAFICFDVDDGSVTTVRTIMHELNVVGIPMEYIHVSFSGGKGYHVEVFFDAIIPTHVLRLLYHWIVYSGKLDTRKVEFRPTQNQSIKLPLGKHHKTGKICWFVDTKTFLPIRTNDYLAEIRKLSADSVMAEIEKIPKVPIRLNECANRERGDRADEVGETGIRHDTLLKMAVDSRRRGESRNECQQLLETWYRTNAHLVSTPEPENEKDMQRILSWVYRESFIVRPLSTEKAHFSRNDIAAVLSLPTKTMRKVFFLLNARQKVCETKIAYREIAQIIHQSIKAGSTINAVNRLEAVGAVYVSRGTPKAVGSGYIMSPRNRYYVQQKYVNGQHKEIAWTDVPGITCMVPELLANFDAVYYSVLRQMVDTDWLRCKLTPTENRELSEALDDVKEDTPYA